jgi:RES domain-containing protein
VTPQLLDRTLTSYRIGDPRGQFPIFDATGSTISPGRWNSTACPVLYSSEHYSTAMLEKLVHGSGRIPPGQHFIRIAIPSGVLYEVLNVAHLPDWHLQTCAASRAYGDAWQQSRRSLLLIVPSVIAREEKNFLLNPHHPDFAKLKPSLAEPVWWDARLFGA